MSTGQATIHPDTAQGEPCAFFAAQEGRAVDGQRRGADERAHVVGGGWGKGRCSTISAANKSTISTMFDINVGGEPVVESSKLWFSYF